MASDTIKKSKRLHQMIGDANTIAIIGHIHPDGDCIGSTMAMYNYIIDNYEGKTIQVYAEEFSPDFMIINGTDKINHLNLSYLYPIGDIWLYPSVPNKYILAFSINTYDIKVFKASQIV